MDEPLRLLAILAHPDDESLGIGGALAKYAAEGVETYLVTATRGQRGRYLGERFGEGDRHPGPEALGQLREAELRAAAEILGVKGLWLLDYVDADLDRADPSAVAEQLAALIREVRPQVVITFGPDGAYGHPDHIAVGQMTLAAIVRAAESATGTAAHRVAKLYYLAWSREVWNAYEAAFGEVSTTVDGVKRLAQPWPEWAITTTVDTTEYWESAWAAVSCHHSQIAAYAALKELEPEHHRSLWGSQRFYRALSHVNGGRAVESDLFEGLR